MAEETYCPKCGGLIFSTGLDTGGMLPCTCTKAGDTAVSTSVRRDQPDAPAAPSVKKVCIKCNADLQGKRRVKDSSGDYWCYDCAKADELKKHGKTASSSGTTGGATARCNLCDTKVPVINLISMNGNFVCPKCAREQRVLATKADARIGRLKEAFQGQELKRMMPLLGIMGILLLIIILRSLGIIGT